MAGRPKGLKNRRKKSEIENSTDNNSKPFLQCCMCGIEINDIKKQTYGSHSNMWACYGKIIYCKKCVEIVYNQLLERFSYDTDKSMYYFCMLFDYPYIQLLFDSSKKYSEEYTQIKPYQRYLTVYNSLCKQNKYPKCFLDGENALIYKTKEDEIVEQKRVRMSQDDKANQKDIVKMLGYDPFENDPDTDKKFLYNKLITFLDEDTVEDSFKVPVVIEIVKGFGHLEKINQAINLEHEMGQNADEEKINRLSLIRARSLKSILDLAKENGISINHKHEKSSGSGTLSGILKELKNKKFTEADVNLFDIETSEGIRQVNDISNQSIVNQLKLDENSYTEMLVDQRKMIQDLDSKLMESEEENRILKIKISELEKQGGNKK